MSTGGQEILEEEDLNLDNLRKRLVEKALRLHSNSGCVVVAAKLGITVRTLYRYLDDYDFGSIYNFKT